MPLDKAHTSPLLEAGLPAAMGRPPEMPKVSSRYGAEVTLESNHGTENFVSERKVATSPKRTFELILMRGLPP